VITGHRYVVTGTEGTPLTEIGMGFSARPARAGRALAVGVLPPAGGG
jgi:hypothetical protein